MHIERQGSGPTLVMLHGWAMHCGIFAPLTEKLRAHFTLYLVDLPGHGHSADSETTLELAACAEHIVRHTPPGLWLGWSLGGLVAQWAAQHFPAHVQGLVPLASSPKFVNDDTWGHGFEAKVFQQFAHELTHHWERTIDRFLMLECVGSDHERGELRLLRQHLFDHGPPRPDRLQQGLDLLAHADLRHALPHIACPTLWIAGARDRLVPAAALQWASEQMPNAQYLRIAGGGHAPFIGHTEQVAHALVTWYALEFDHGLF